MNHKRIQSLDMLRGADIFLLTVIVPILEAVNRFCHLPKGLMHQFCHPEWVGFSVLDMIMPLFIFMCGAALPIALPKRRNPDGSAGWPYWRHVLWRVAVLWFLGLIAQGQLLTFDIDRISWFNNTLQTIACGYLIAAIVSCVKSRIVRTAIPFALVLAYTVFLHLCGDMTPTGNAAVVYETKFLSLFYPDPSVSAVAQIAEMHYTWWPTIPMFGFMALMGAQSTEIILGAKAVGTKIRDFVLRGIGLVLLGGIFAIFDPVIKHVFTASFTFLAMGASVLLYGLFYYLFDVLSLKRGLNIVSLFGRHSLLAYMLTESTFRGILYSAVAITVGGDGLLRYFRHDVAALVLDLLVPALLCLVIRLWDGYRSKR